MNKLRRNIAMVNFVFIMAIIMYLVFIFAKVENEPIVGFKKDKVELSTPMIQTDDNISNESNESMEVEISPELEALRNRINEDEKRTPTEIDSKKVIDTLWDIYREDK